MGTWSCIRRDGGIIKISSHARSLYQRKIPATPITRESRKKQNNWRRSINKTGTSE